MKSSLTIVRVAGIDAYLHFIFLILLGGVARSYYFQRRSQLDIWGGLGFRLCRMKSSSPSVPI